MSTYEVKRKVYYDSVPVFLIGNAVRMYQPRTYVEVYQDGKLVYYEKISDDAVGELHECSLARYDEPGYGRFGMKSVRIWYKGEMIKKYYLFSGSPYGRFDTYTCENSEEVDATYQRLLKECQA